MAQSGIATLLGLRGDKPEVPEWKPVLLPEQQGQAIQANLSQLPKLEDLASELNRFNVDELQTQLASLIPGYQEKLALAGENVAAGLRGQLPKDVTDYLQREAAQRGVTLGTTGSQGARGVSQFQEHDYLRTLGLTSLDETRRSLDTFQRWTAMAANMNQRFNVTSMFITPLDQFQATFQNQQAQFNVDWLKNQISALPSNEEMAYAQMLDYVATWATSAASFGTSGMMGGGGGMGMGGGQGQYGYYPHGKTQQGWDTPRFREANAAWEGMQRPLTIPSYYNTAPSGAYGPGY